MKLSLTEAQEKVLQAIKQYKATNDNSPTIREIGEMCGLTSPNGVMAHLRAIQRKGWITFGGFKSRNIKIVEESKVKTWKERVLDEKAELDARIDHLIAFLKSPEHGALEKEDKMLLIEQEQRMRAYSETLAKRIARF